MRWFRENWELKLLALAMAIFLWYVLHRYPPEATLESIHWPPFLGSSR